MSTNLIRTANLSSDAEGGWNPATFYGHHVVLAPMFAIHLAAQVQASRGEAHGGQRWEWIKPTVALEAAPTIWSMTGRWNARRPVTMTNADLEASIERDVPALARLLNRHGVRCLRDVALAKPTQYRSLTRSIHAAVLRVSQLRKTTQIEPVLGSKVLHHYFPSVVPVFDTRFIRHDVMRSEPYRASIDSWRGRVLFRTAAEAGGQSMLDFHHYFTFCAWQIGEASESAIHATRTKFAKAMAPIAPSAMVKDCESMLWRLDAKIAEYCAVNALKK